MALTGMQIFLVVLLGGLCLLSYLMPRLTRRDLYFAVTVPPPFRDSPDGVKILRRYRAEVIVQSLIGLALALLSLRPRPIVWLFLLGLGWQVVGCFVAYLRARWRVMPHAVGPIPVREAELALRPGRLPGGWVIQLAPFAILAAAAVWLYLHWQEIPERFPVHWGFDGKPNGWAQRNFSGVYSSLIVAGIICAGLALFAYGTLRWTRRIQVRGGPAKSETRFRHTILWVLLATEYFLALMFSWVSTFALRGERAMPSPVATILSALAFTIVITVVLVCTGQGGSRLAEYRSASPEQAATPVGDRTLDRYWIAGVIYYNRDDPAIIVEKRFGVGYTLNLAHPLPWIVVALLALVPLALSLLMHLHSG